MPSLQEEFKVACSPKVAIDSKTADLAQQVLERCHNTILETSTFGYGQPAQVKCIGNNISNEGCASDSQIYALHEALLLLRLESGVLTGRACQTALLCVSVVYSQDGQGT